MHVIAHPVNACRYALLSLLLGGVLAGCAAPPSATPAPKQSSINSSTPTKVTTGRLGLQFIDGTAPSVQLGFSLQGDRSEGQLVLETPFGTALASAQWNSQQALLIRGQSQQTFATLDALLEQELGSDLPVDALFAWINKKSSAELSAAGWLVEDVQNDVRLRATRTAPPPSVRLTLVLDTAP